MGVEYAEPRDVSSTEECDFYHVMELPEVGLVGGQWDLRPTIDEYLGGYDFTGKRVLDVGTASGFLSFEIERRAAAEVVSFDIGEDVDWDVVPFSDLDLAANRERHRRMREPLVNGYWLAHRLLGSRAKAYYGYVYDLPRELGEFDVAVLGTVLTHLRDPFRALESVSRLVREAIVITDGWWDSEEPLARLIPGPDQRTPNVWWRLSHGCVSRMLGILGFEAPAITGAEHLDLSTGEPAPRKLATFVARRPAS